MSKKKYPAPDGDLIIIRLNGDETVASILDCDFGIGCTGQAIAKRNPKDEYDAYIGARVALDRLFDKDFFEEHQEDDAPKKDKAPEKTQTRWEVGDRVIATGHPINPNLYGKEGKVTKAVPALTLGEIRYYADFGGRTQTWCSFNTDAVKKAPKKTDAAEKEAIPEPKFQVGDIVRVTNSTFSFGFYKNGDVAVVTKVVPYTAPWFRTIYRIKVRSKERKGSEGVAFAEELTLLHRPAKEGEKR